MIGMQEQTNILKITPPLLWAMQRLLHRRRYAPVQFSIVK